MTTGTGPRRRPSTGRRRRTTVAAAVVAAVTGLAGGVLGAVSTAAPALADSALSTPIGDRGLALGIRPFAQLPTSGGQPEVSTFASSRDGRLIVGTLQGKVYEITGGSVRTTGDLEQATGGQLDEDGGVHGGFQGMALSPQFASNGKIYTATMEARPASTAGRRYLSDVPTPVRADSVVTEWVVRGGTLDPSSRRELFRVGVPVYDHAVKALAFGPDGMLYVAHGDGSVQSATAGGGMRNDALGKVLRIDPTP